MRRIWSVAVPRYDLPDTTWQQVGNVMRSRMLDATITPIAELMWTADTDSAEVAGALARAVTAVGAQPLSSSRQVYDEEDYAAADLIGVFGVDLPVDPPFVRNAAEAYRADPPCVRCGHHDPFDVTPVEPPRIDEALLEGPAPDGSRPGPRGWEAVNLPNGGLLVSTRLRNALRDAGIRGLATEQVLDATGAVSARMALLRAPVAVPNPCPCHPSVEGTAFCPNCGSAYGELHGYFWMPRSVIGDAEIVSRHPHHAAMLYVSPRVYAILAKVPGIRRGDPIRVCDH